MTEPVEAPDIVDHGVSDVLTEDEIVHVPPAAADLAESIDHPESGFIADVPDWDAPDATH